MSGSNPWPLPAKWCWSFVGEIAAVEPDLVPPLDFPDLPHIAPNHIESGSGRLLRYTTVSADGVTSPKHRFAPGHILYSKIRPYLAKAVRVDFRGLCSADMYPIRSDIEPGYLHRWLISPSFTTMVAESQGRTVLPKINEQALRKKAIPVAPLNEQKRIVAKLEALQARADAAKQALDAIPPLLEKFRQSVLAAAFRGDLTREWRARNPDVEPASELLARIRAERRRRWEEANPKKKYVEPDPVDTSALPELPKGWCWASADQLALIKGGLAKGKKRNPAQALRQVPYLRVANVQRGFLDLSEVHSIEASESEIEDLRLISGDILLNEGGDRDKLGRGWIWEEQLSECIHQNHVFRARIVSNELLPRFVSNFANSPHAQRYFLGSGKQTTNLASISLSQLRALPIPLCSRAEQNEIIRLLTNALATAEKMETAMQNSQDACQRLSRSRLAKAFRGELVPQDPDDEPAEVLLERIRAERAGSEGGGKKRRGRARS